MQKSVYTASCPICGRVLFKGSPDSYIEGGCPKCGEYLKISFTDGKISGKYYWINKKYLKKA